MDWTRRSTNSTAWVTPGHVCLCAHNYGHGAAVVPQPGDSVWNGVMGLWSRVATLLTPSCALGEVPSGVNLNQYAGWGSSIPWHYDNQLLFGDQGDPKVIVSLSLGSSVDFRWCRRGRRNAPSLMRLEHGDLLVMDGLAQSEYEHSTSSELQGPGRPYIPVDIPAHPDLLVNAGRGLLGAAIMCARFCPGWIPVGERAHFQCRPWGWLVHWLVVVACLSLACASIAPLGVAWLAALPHSVF